MNKFRKSRKSLFLASTILRGRRLKDDNEQGGNVTEVGPGFAAAAEKMGSDDNRAPEQRGTGATQEIPAEEGGENPDGEDEEGGENVGEPTPKPKRKTSEYIRDLKKELREEKAARLAQEARLAALENGGLPNKQIPDTSSDTSGRPDPTDSAKYPLGVLDDGYTADMIEWTADQKVAKAFQKIEADNKALQTRTIEEARASELRGKLDTLADKGAEQFDDFEESVVEAGLRGDWKLTETTFTAAAEAENGPAILHALANDKTEALRVSQLSPFQQLKYVADKDAEISGKKPKARTVPKAGTPPQNLPAGRNASAPIRADTDNLDDFRKVFYQK